MRKSLIWLNLVGLFFVTDVRSASAGCISTFRGCVQVAQAYKPFWERFLGVLDCELDLVGCIKDKLLP